MNLNEEKRIIQEEALEALKKNNYKGFVILPTGAGKSYVLIEALKRLYKPGMNVLYACDSKRLRDVDFQKELEKWGAGSFTNLIEKKCYATTYKYTGKHYNIGLLDEGDYALTPNYSKLLANNSFDYLIIVSATLENNKRRMVETLSIPIVFERKVKEIEEKGVVNKAQFVYVPYILNDKENLQYLQFNKLYRGYLNQEQTPFIKKRLEFLHIERSQFMAGLDSSAFICKKLLTEIASPSTRMLIFCGLTKQAERIWPYSYHSGNEDKDNLNKFNEGEISALAVVGKINRGVNLNTVNTIILENCKRSETLMIQRTGRGRRLNIGEILYIYTLIPYYKTEYGLIKPTIVKEWIYKAAKDMGIENAKTHIVKV